MVFRAISAQLIDSYKRAAMTARADYRQFLSPSVDGEKQA